MPFFLLSGAGNEYAYAKLVYLSPQFSGVDFGIQYAPTLSNGLISYGQPVQWHSYQWNGCWLLGGELRMPDDVVGPGINDGSHALNQTAVGARYQGTFGCRRAGIRRL